MTPAARAAYRAAYKKARAERPAPTPDPALRDASTEAIRRARDLLDAETDRLAYLARLVAAALDAALGHGPVPHLPRRVPPVLHQPAIRRTDRDDAALPPAPVPPFDLVALLYPPDASADTDALRAAGAWLEQAAADYADERERMTREVIARYRTDPGLALEHALEPALALTAGRPPIALSCPPWSAPTPSRSPSRRSSWS